MQHSTAAARPHRMSEDPVKAALAQPTENDEGPLPRVFDPQVMVVREQ